MNKTVIALFVSVLGGCSGPGQNLITEQRVAVERIDSQAAQITHVYVTDERDGMHVHGTLRRSPGRFGAIFGHVDVSVIAPNGEMIARFSVGSRRDNRQSQYARFTAVIDDDTAVGSVVRLTHHRERHD